MNESGMSEWLLSTYGCLSVEAIEKNVMVIKPLVMGIINVSKSSICLQKKMRLHDQYACST